MRKGSRKFQHGSVHQRMSAAHGGLVGSGCMPTGTHRGGVRLLPLSISGFSIWWLCSCFLWLLAPLGQDTVDRLSLGGASNRLPRRRRRAAAAAFWHQASEPRACGGLIARRRLLRRLSLGTRCPCPICRRSRNRFLGNMHAMSCACEYTTYIFRTRRLQHGCEQMLKQ